MPLGVNLLPWRRRRRLWQRNVFVGQLLATLVAAGVLVGATEFVLEARIDRQKQRQLALIEQIRRFDARIDEVDTERRQHDDLATRAEDLRRLCNQRGTALGIFEALAQTLASGTHYTAISRRGSTLSAAGAAATSDRVSQLMRNLGASQWFDAPSLQRIGSAPDALYGSAAAAFEITVSVTAPGQEPEAEERGITHDA